MISGPTFRLHAKWPGNVDIDERRGSAYSLLVATLSNPRRYPLAEFVDSILRAYNARLGLDSPIGQATAYAATIAGLPARVIKLPCGDCWPYEVYLGRRDRVVLFAFSTDDNDLLDALSAPLYWLMMSTFRWVP
jgi:hypothetical protein